LNTKIISDGDMFVVTHDVFCKFVDGKGFDPDKNKNEWSPQNKFKEIMN